ncbi:MAG: hypothetical protein K6F83_03975 [Clostridiales bacterium]|nr:hypothetical protein [Clostridiales bacterium]
MSNRPAKFNPFIWIAIGILFIVCLIGFVVFRTTSMLGSFTVATEPSFEVIETNAGTITVSFTETDEAGKGKTVYINTFIKQGQLPSYPNKDQTIWVNGSNETLKKQVVDYLESLGYTHIEQTDH